MWNHTIIGIVTAALTAGGALAWSWHDRSEAVRRFQVTGVVVAAPENGVLRIAHDDIPGYMPAMTMAFAVGEAGSPAVAAGDRVRFSLRVAPDGVTAERIAVVGRAAPAVTRAGGAIARLSRGDALPAISLVDEEGRRVTERDFLGRTTFVTFVYTRCPLPEFCPAITSRFKQLQAALAKDQALARKARLLSVTLDPAYDTPAVLKDYARAIGADPARWSFASGDPAEVLKVARAFSVYVEQNGAILDHTLATALVDENGQVREIWRGNGWSVNDLLAALR
jgi:protein SCO1